MHRVSGCYGDGSVSVSHSFRMKTKRAVLADADRVPLSWIAVSPSSSITKMIKHYFSFFVCVSSEV